MAQTEDTELTDLVVEALEKNGSLAKIRALLRANIFLAFEDECENIRHNMSLDNVLKIPEGIYALSVVHEFLEFCNLKNTLFVYKSESRQGKDYKYEGKKCLFNKLNLNKLEMNKEPVLLTLIKNSVKQNFQKNHNMTHTIKKQDDSGDHIDKDEQNSSYIVHEDSQSSVTSTSQSDNSIDEKNKLHLRLQLDNSDTDTSSDSSRGKSASEYIPSEHVIQAQNSNSSKHLRPNVNVDNSILKQELSIPPFLSKMGSSSSDSTSYVELKPYSSKDEKMLNTSGLPHTAIIEEPPEELNKNQSDHSKTESSKTSISGVSSLSMKMENRHAEIIKKLSQESTKSDGETIDYSPDFSASQGSHKINSDRNKSESPKGYRNEEKSSPIVSPHQNSQSSVSISDVADLISDKSSSFEQSNHESPENKTKSTYSSKKTINLHNKLNSDDSGDFSESPIPSLSNLSLDIHSD